MTETVVQSRPLELSSKFVHPEEVPLTCSELLEGVEQWDGDIEKCSVAVSEKGGASRTRVRPIIKSVGDASALEVADMAFAIAFADVLKRGETTRYCAELVLRDGEGVRSAPKRIYFNLTPEDVAAVEKHQAANQGPSLEYVTRLEDRVLELTDRLSRASMRVLMHEDRGLKLAWSAVEARDRSRLLEKRGEIEFEEAKGRNRRRDVLFNGIVRVLPKVADKAAERFLGIKPGEAPAAKALNPKPPPLERMADICTDEQLAKFLEALGPEDAEAMKAATSLAEAQKIIQDADAKTQHELLEILGEDTVLAISMWEE